MSTTPTPAALVLSATTSTTSGSAETSPNPDEWPGREMSLLEVAYQMTRREFLAIPDDQLIPIRIDLRAAYAIVAGSAPRILAMRDELATLSRFDISAVDNLQRHAWTATYADSRTTLTSFPKPPVAELVEKAAEARDLLLHDLKGLANRHIVDGSPLHAIGRRTTHFTTGSHLLALVVLARERMPAIRGKTAITHAQLNDHERLVIALGDALATQWQQRRSRHELVKERQQAFTLMANTYDEVRRGVAFLRWKQGDANKIAPSLYSVRARRKGKAELVEAPAEPAEPTEAPESPTTVNESSALPNANEASMPDLHHPSQGPWLEQGA